MLLVIHVMCPLIRGWRSVTRKRLFVPCVLLLASQYFGQELNGHFDSMVVIYLMQVPDFLSYFTSLKWSEPVYISTIKFVSDTLQNQLFFVCFSNIFVFKKLQKLTQELQ